METRLRSWAKSISWRLIGIIILGGISYAFTNNWAQTTWITIVFHSVRLVLYYVHERGWERVSWGRIKHPLSYLPVKKSLTREDHEAIRRLLKERECLSLPDYEI